MTPEHDFRHSPRQRQRRGETRFYGAMGVAAAVGVAAVMTLGWFIEGDRARLAAATLVLRTELQQLQPRLAQVAALETKVELQRKQLALQVEQARQRAFAPHALHVLATISATQLRLQHIVVRDDGAEIRGAAGDQRQLQDLLDALKSSGLGQVRLQEMRQAPALHDRPDPHDPSTPPSLRYSFTVSLTSSTAAPATPPAQAPSQSDSQAAIERAKRT